jgi:hypothetical protein
MKRKENRGRPSLSADKIELALMLYDKGVLIRDIIRTVPISQGTLYKAIKSRK